MRVVAGRAPRFASLCVLCGLSAQWKQVLWVCGRSSRSHSGRAFDRLRSPDIFNIGGRTTSIRFMARAAEQIPGMATTYEVLSEGSQDGKKVSKGAVVTVHATGVVQETGKKFWSTKDPGQEPFTYSAGVGQVIKGWDKGCLGMTEGEQRKLIIPAAEGYGAKGFPSWGIPPGGTLEFTLECLKIQ
eukprot:TRINITY_DN106509_c0_g1_i1.p1 TRINITY_DN106509_c0_g1~~TRINITY_DN106509_c0_g1_i1.p1  ORF type:complete len:202 (-),score=28.42 TRINITY_DN106509_c0_g1_i1:197-754(-)